MSRRLPPRLVEAAVVLFALALAGVTILDEVGPHDEGLVLAAASRVASGQLPYRDFWWNYGPGEPVLLAGLVKLLGPSLLWWRVARVLAGAAVAWLAARLARRGDAPEGWVLAAGLAAASAVAWPLTPGPTVPALVPALAALALAARGRGAAAGALAGVAAWLRPELGLAALLGAAAALRGGVWRLGPPGVAESAARPALARVVGAFALAVVVLYGPFVAAAPGAFWDDVVGFARIQGLQRLPFPLSAPSDPNKAFETLFPALLVAAAALWLVVARARPLPLLAAVAVGVAYLLARTDEFHLVPLAAVLPPALAVGAAGRGRATRAVLGAAVGVIALGGVERQAGRLLHPPALAAVPGGVADGVRTTAADAAALRALVPRVRAIGRPVFVAPPRLDRVRVGDPLLDVILRLPNPTRYDVIQPGLVTTDTVQRELVGDLERTRATVVRWTAPAATEREPNGAGREHGSRRFDAFVAHRYRPVLRRGDYVVLVPR